MEAKLRFFGEIEEDAAALVDLEEAQGESSGLLQGELAAECLGNDGI